MEKFDILDNLLKDNLLVKSPTNLQSKILQNIENYKIIKEESNTLSLKLITILVPLCTAIFIIIYFALSSGNFISQFYITYYKVSLMIYNFIFFSDYFVFALIGFIIASIYTFDSYLKIFSLKKLFVI